MARCYCMSSACVTVVGKMMEELTDDSLDDDLERPLERWAPLGAANASPLMCQSEPV